MQFKGWKSPLFQQIKRKALTSIGKPQSAGPYLKVFPDDVFIVSYPRSGNTWMRFLIGSMVFHEEMNFDNMDQIVPDIYRCTNQFLEGLQRPRYLKSHEPYDERYPKVIYLVRDPRDVAISYYKWMQKYRKLQESFDEFLVEFTKNKTRYAGWGENVKSWYEQLDRIPEGGHLIRYEDLLTEPLNKLTAIAKFLSLPISRDQLEKIIHENRFDQMRKKEMQAKSDGFIQGKQDNIRFIRKGTTGQWQDILTTSQLEMFADSFQGIASKMGYDLSL